MKTAQEQREYRQKWKQEGYKPCIYAITNQHTGEQYVGATINLRQRMASHWCELRGGRNHSARFLEAFDRDKEAAFRVSVLEYVTEQELVEREAHHIRTLRPFYNGTPGKYEHKKKVIENPLTLRQAEKMIEEIREQARLQIVEIRKRIAR